MIPPATAVRLGSRFSRDEGAFRLSASLADMPIASRSAPIAGLDRGAPKLLVIIDTEEEFDWTQPFSRAATGVAHIRHQERAQRIFERFALRPTYVVDYPVASQEAGYRPLREWLMEGRCAVGAHLHPWVNPPFEEDVSVRNSYAGNLPAALERAKLARLTETIEANFGRRPTLYRAGRYGIGPATAEALAALGYEIDSSVVPWTDFRADTGPDFRRFGDELFWFGPGGRLLEIPLTVGWYGRLRRHGRTLQPLLAARLAHTLHLPGILARLGLFERIRLSPEGADFAELQRLTETLLRAGKRLFSLTYHSPSLAPGHTPYVRNAAELQGFLKLLEQYCDYFFGRCGGVAGTPEEIRALALAGAAAGRRVA